MQSPASLEIDLSCRVRAAKLDLFQFWVMSEISRTKFYKVERVVDPTPERDRSDRGRNVDP